MAGAFRFNTDVEAGMGDFREPVTRGGTRPGVTGEPKIKFTFRKPLEILAMEFNPQDLVLENGYLEKGSPCAFFCAAPTIKITLL